MNTKEFVMVLGNFVAGIPDPLKHLTDFEGTETVPVVFEIELPKKVVQLLEDYQERKGMEEYRYLLEEALLKSLIGTCGAHRLAVTPDMLTLLIIKDRG